MCLERVVKQAGCSDTSTTYYVALPFIASDEGPMPIDAVECPSASIAASTAAALSRNAKYIGALAFQRTGDPNGGEFGDAEIIGTFGEKPRDLSTF